MESEVVIQLSGEAESAHVRTKMGPMKMARFLVQNYGASTNVRLEPGKVNSFVLKFSINQ